MPKMRKARGRTPGMRKSKRPNTGFKKKFKPNFAQETEEEVPNVSDEVINAMHTLLEQIAERPDYHTHEKFASLRYYRLTPMGIDVSVLHEKFGFKMDFLIDIKTPVQDLLDYFGLEDMREHVEFFNKISGVITLRDLRTCGIKAKELLDQNVPFEELYFNGGYLPKELRVGGIDHKTLKAFLHKEAKKYKKPKLDKSEFIKSYKPKRKKKR